MDADSAASFTVYFAGTADKLVGQTIPAGNSILCHKLCVLIYLRGLLLSQMYSVDIFCAEVTDGSSAEPRTTQQCCTDQKANMCICDMSSICPIISVSFADYNTGHIFAR